MNKHELICAAKALKTNRSQWDKGIKYYIEAIVERAEFERGELNTLNARLFEKRLLSGAENWREASLGGCFLIHDKEIADTLAPASKRERIGEGTHWLEIQARALSQASACLVQAFCKLK